MVIEPVTVTVAADEKVDQIDRQLNIPRRLPTRGNKRNSRLTENNEQRIFVKSDLPSSYSLQRYKNWLLSSFFSLFLRDNT